MTCNKEQMSKESKFRADENAVILISGVPIGCRGCWDSERCNRELRKLQFQRRAIYPLNTWDKILRLARQAYLCQAPRHRQDAWRGLLTMRSYQGLAFRSFVSAPRLGWRGRRAISTEGRCRVIILYEPQPLCISKHCYGSFAQQRLSVLG